jgi:hypothetical protein
VILVVSNMLFCSFLFAKPSPGTFADLFTERLVYIFLIFYWVLLIRRAYQLWFQPKESIQ